jgi:tripartite-type tricarboxylate transporter receptor subunit TctC
MNSFDNFSRRDVLGGLGAMGAAGLIGLPGAAEAASFPTGKFTVTIPTRQGGGAERLARAFDATWSKKLGQPFEYEFFPGASGQVGYTLFIKKRPHDGHHLLFGNMGPEMIMYALRNPAYKFPDDYIYFCSVDVDDSAFYVRNDSRFKRVEDIVAEAKKKPLNVATSRIPHPASIGALALGEATGAKFNLIPYGGGNPTITAVLNGEVEVGVLPISSPARLPQKIRILGVFNKTKNVLAAQTNNAPTINSVFGTKIPDLYSSRSWAIHADWANKNPDAMKKLEETAAQTVADPAFKAAFAKTGAPAEVLQYGDRKSCTEYALAMVELANKYKPILTAKRKRGK